MLMALKTPVEQITLVVTTDRALRQLCPSLVVVVDFIVKFHKVLVNIELEKEWSPGGCVALVVFFGILKKL